MAEIASIFKDSPYELLSLEDARAMGLLASIPTVVEDGGSFEANAYKKATQVMEQEGIAVLADDSGLEIDALGGLPGVDSAYYLGEGTPYSIRNAHIIEQMKGLEFSERGARFRCVIVVAFPNGKILTSFGICEGSIATEPSGAGGFGYDTIFVPDGGDKTFAQLSRAEKNVISHRAHALAGMKKQLLATDCNFPNTQEGGFKWA